MPIHNPEFKPIALIDENIALYYSGAWHYFKVKYIRPLFRSANLITDFGVVAAEGSAASILQPDDQLDIKKSEIGQIRCKPLDDFEFDIRTGATDAVAATSDVVTRVSKHLEETDPTWATTEWFYKYTDLYYFGIYNPYPYDIDRTRIAWWGYKFDVDALPEKPERAIYCPMERW